MVSPRQFDWQMTDLASRGFRSLTLDQYWAALERESTTGREVLLTFDDAYAHVETAVTPALRRHGFSAVMFVPHWHLADRNCWDAEHRNLAQLAIASPEQIRSMAGGLWEIASHGLRHVDLTSLEPEQCRRELAESRERLSDLAGKPVRDLAYPYGAQNVAVRAAARTAGYRMAFTAGRTSEADRFALDRRPIRGTDSRAVFRMKTSRLAGLLYEIADRSPAWTRSAIRGLRAKPSTVRT